MLKIRNMILILISSIAIGTILIIGVYCLPVEKMFNHLESSVDFIKTGDVPRWSKNVIHTSLDNFADVIMLTKAAYPVENVIESAMLNPSWSSNVIPAKTFSEGFVKLIEMDYRGFDDKPFTYPRYWHGYLTILKPALLIFTAEQLRILNLYVQFLLLITALILIYKKLGIYYFYSFALMILFYNPITTVLAFQHTNVYCIMLLTVILILRFNENLKIGSRYTYFFMTVGILTAYFDLLTCPLVPLGIGLIFYFVLNKPQVLSLIEKCFAWGFGYVGMWSGKILAATILTKENVISDAFGELMIRTSHHEGHGLNGESISIFGTFLKNINSFCEGPIRIVLIILFIYCCYVLYKKNFIFKKNIVTGFLFITALPFMWYTAACNHSFMHNHFTYRELTITFLGILAFIIESIPELKNKIGGIKND